MANYLHRQRGKCEGGGQHSKSPSATDGEELTANEQLGNCTQPNLGQGASGYYNFGLAVTWHVWQVTLWEHFANSS